MAKTFTYESEYGNYRVTVSVAAYADGNLAVRLDDAELGGMTFAILTKNLHRPLPPMHAYIDTNNLGEWAVAFLVKNNLAKLTRFAGRSGYCEYPLVKFDPEELAKADPEGYGEFAARSAAPAMAI